VLAWLGTVPGLTPAQLAAVNDIMAEDEYEGAQLVGLTAKSLRRLLKGTAAEDAVPALLAARDAHLAAEAAEPEPAAAGCQICFEAYGSVRQTLTSELHAVPAAPGPGWSLFLNRATLLRPGRSGSDWRRGAARGLCHACCRAATPSARAASAACCGAPRQHFRRRPASEASDRQKFSGKSNRGTICRRRRV
jgi:hypothetical protein